MDFRVFISLEIPLIDKKYELMVPIDRRIHDLISILKKNIPELSENYYKNKEPNIYNKATGMLYDKNQILKNSNIKNGTRLVLI